MATADKTRDKLVESMRKSKTGAARKTAAGKPATTKRAAPAKKKTARRAPSRKAVQPRPAPTAAAMRAVTWQVSNDPYQSDGRIWPD